MWPEGLRAQQLAFANHLRDPARFPAPPGLEERRLRIYRELFFNNIRALLATTFPVIRSLLDDARWETLVRDFYRDHRCETPLFPFIAGEFADYLQQAAELPDGLPFLAELAQYEWSEIALRHADAAAVPGRQGDKPRLSPLCWPLVFHFPVHRIGRDYIPQEPPDQPTCLLLCRIDDTVRFIESGPATLRLLQLLEDENLPDLAAVTAQLAAEMQHPDPVQLAAELRALIQQLVHQGVFLS